MMDRRRILQATSRVVGLFLPLFLVPVPFAFAYGEPMLRDSPVPASAFAFIAAAMLGTLIWLPGAIATRHADGDVQQRESYLAVALGSLIIAALAMIPFLLTGSGIVAALLDSVAGLTTTGTSLVDDSLASIQVWRGLLSYIGGFAFLVLGISVLSALTRGARAKVDALHSSHPRLGPTARLVAVPYLLLGGALFVLLFFMLMDNGATPKQASLDGLILAMSTLSTGGYTTIVLTPSLKAALLPFMLIAATNFLSLADNHWRIDRALWTSEGRLFMAMLFGGSLFAAAWLREPLEGAFLMFSAVTGAGFDTIQPDALLLAFILLLVITGGMVGSTSGGLKTVRLLLMVKVVRREVRRLLHPRAIIPVRLDGRSVREHRVLSVVAFVFAFATTWLVGAIVLAIMEPTLGAFDGAIVVASMMSNHGSHFGMLSDGFEGLHAGSHLLLTALMWLGRLEIFTALLLLRPDAWRN